MVGAAAGASAARAAPNAAGEQRRGTGTRMAANENEVLMDDTTVVLAAEGLGKQVSSPEGTLAILSDVTLSIRRGESVAIIGASGAGKSTLLALLAGLDEPTSGQVLLGGQRPDAARRGRPRGRAGEPRRLRVPVVPPRAVAHGARERDAAARARRPPRCAGSCAGGARPRRAWPRASVTIRGSSRAASSSASRSRARSSGKPDVLFADEPTGNLDTATGEKIMDLLFGLNRATQTHARAGDARPAARRALRPHHPARSRARRRG